MSPLVSAVSRLLLAPILVAAAALLVKGYNASGDGFSAGTLAALAVLMRGAAVGGAGGRGDLAAGAMSPRAALAGIAVMLAVVLAGPALGGQILEHWPPHGAPKPPSLGHLELHTALLYDVGIAIVVFVTIVSVIQMVARERFPGRRR